MTFLALRLLALGCAAMVAFAPAGAAAAEPFKLGVIIPKTGIYAPFAKFIEPGLIVGAEEVNAAGGIQGRKVELVVRDDASNSARALMAAKELIGDQKVDALYTGVISGIVLATLPYVTEQKVLSFANGSSEMIGDARKYPYSFQLSDIGSRRVAPVIEAVRKLGGKRVGILVSTNPPQVALGQGLVAELPKRGLEVASYITYSDPAKDFTPQLQKLRDEKADIVVFDGMGREGIRLVMAGMQTLGWNAKVVSEPAVLSGDLVPLVPQSYARNFYAVNSMAGTRTSGARDPRMQDFINKLKAHGSVENLAWSALARDAVFLMKWAFETAQQRSGNTSPESLKAALESLSAPSTRYPADYSLVFGNPRYTAADHSTNNADYSKFWGLITISPLIDGTYGGEPLLLTTN
jgi:branched-chain amino acid transport system substrate-binding protein